MGSGHGGGWVQGFKDVIKHWWIVIRCSFIGAIVGFLPGLGGSVIDWIAYGHVVQTSRDKSQFGKGDIRGVIGPESAANAKEGGALIPTLFFGIPGSGTMALLLGGLVVIGITPGRTMVTNHMDLVFVIIWSIALANILGTAISMLLAKPISQVTVVPFTWIAPFILVMIYLSAYQATFQWGDIITLIGIGVLGIFMKRFGWSRAALLIGFVLSQRLEASMYRTVQIYGWDLFLRPISVIIMVLAVVSLYLAYRNKAHAVSDATIAALKESMPTLGKQVAFTVLLFATTVWFMVDVLQLRFLAYVFPLSVACIMLALLAWVLVGFALRKPWPGLISDSDTEVSESAPSTQMLVGWFLLLPSAAALLGFIFAAPLYVYVFTRRFAHASQKGAIISAVAVYAVLLVLVNVVMMKMPDGLLQMYLPAVKALYMLS